MPKEINTRLSTESNALAILGIVNNFKLNNKNQGIKAFMGCYMLIPKAVIERCGMFDPDFFMYSEEIDLCRRITKMNYKLFFYTELNAIHLFGGSTTDNQWANHQKLLSNALLHLKSGGIFNYLLYHFIWHINLISNFFAMWLLDKDYRKNFFAEQKYYFSNFAYYITIPFLYTKKPGNGKRLLRRS